MAAGGGGGAADGCVPADGTGAGGVWLHAAGVAAIAVAIATARIEIATWKDLDMVRNKIPGAAFDKL